jgi:hypothetical protein
VAEFLVELFVPRTQAPTIDSHASRARTAAADVTREGSPVRYVRAIFVPEDETCLLLFEALSVEAVHATLRRAALTADRVAAATSPHA